MDKYNCIDLYCIKYIFIYIIEGSKIQENTVLET